MKKILVLMVVVVVAGAVVYARSTGGRATAGDETTVDTRTEERARLQDNDESRRAYARMLAEREKILMQRRAE